MPSINTAVLDQAFNILPMDVLLCLIDALDEDAKSAVNEYAREKMASPTVEDTDGWERIRDFTASDEDKERLAHFEEMEDLFGIDGKSDSRTRLNTLWEKSDLGTAEQVGSVLDLLTNSRPGAEEDVGAIFQDVAKQTGTARQEYAQAKPMDIPRKADEDNPEREVTNNPDAADRDSNAARMAREADERERRKAEEQKKSEEERERSEEQKRAEEEQGALHHGK